MDNSKKKLILITLAIVWGIFSLTYYLENVDWMQPIPKDVGVFEIICWISSYLAMGTNFKLAPNSAPAEFGFVYVTQILYYFIFGWLVANKIFKDKAYTLNKNIKAKDFIGKVVAVTGGASGIGYALARKFGQEGAAIALADLDELQLKEAVEKLAQESIKAEYFICDVSKVEEIQSFADNAWKTYGHVDVIVNNAGIAFPPAPVVETNIKDVQKLFDIDFYGVWNGSKIFAQKFIEQGTPAAIYNLGSENSFFNGFPGTASYVAAKHAVLALTEALREELPDFIDVGIICPGLVNTKLGAPELMNQGMPVDKFADIVMKQIKNGEFYIVSHAYNAVRLEDRFKSIKQAYDTYAPRYDNDIEYDIRTLLQKK